MNCDEAEPLLDLINDGVLPAKDCALVLDHLQSCAKCNREWAQFELMRQRFKSAKEAPAMPASLPKKITEALIEEDRAARAKAIRQLWKPAFSAMSVVAAVAALVFFTTQARQTNNTDALAATLVHDMVEESSLKDTGRLKNYPKDQLNARLGYELKYLPLTAWQLDKCGVCVNQNAALIARLDFIKSEAKEVHLTCFQAQAGTIIKSGESKTGDAQKQLNFGAYGKYHFAYWCQNGRDYLFVSAMPKLELEALVRAAAATS